MKETSPHIRNATCRTVTTALTTAYQYVDVENNAEQVTHAWTVVLAKHEVREDNAEPRFGTS
jgi:hypothetical protein